MRRRLNIALILAISTAAIPMSLQAQPRAWVKATPANAPPPRLEAATAYDTFRKRLVLFGGSVASSDAATAQLADTWEYDGVTWVLRDQNSPPGARQRHAMAYDSGRGRIVLFGGYGGTNFHLDDTWEWDGATWRQILPLTHPPGRQIHGMAYDTGRARVVLFGGEAAGPSQQQPVILMQDTWEWDGTSWVNRTPTASPPNRGNAGLAYDSGRGRTVLFGGEASFSPHLQFQDTWEWDGSGWTRDFPSTSPSARESQGMAYDATRGRTVLFGGGAQNGQAGQTVLGDTWEWDGTNWVDPSPTTSPTARGVAELVYDVARSRIVLFGGVVVVNGQFQFLNETWELPSAQTGPTPPAVFGLSYSATTVTSATPQPIGVTVTFTEPVAATPSPTVSFAKSSGTGSAPNPIVLAPAHGGTSDTVFVGSFFPSASNNGKYLLTFAATDVDDALQLSTQPTLNVSIAISINQPCLGSQQRSLVLTPGLNVVAIPLSPCRRSYSAQDFLQDSGSNFVARSAAGKFDVYLPGLGLTPWAIDGSNGYIVRVTSGRTILLTGDPWP